MIKLQTRNLRPGMVPVQSVYNAKGASYLVKGIPLTEQYIQRLRQLGIRELYVTSTMPELPIKLPEDVLQEETRHMAVDHVYQLFESFQQQQLMDIEPVERAADAIVGDLVLRRKNLVQLNDIRTYDMYTFAHSVNVAVLSAIIGTLCNLDTKRMHQLTLGSLLHDLGKTRVPQGILNKQGRLTKEEFDIIRQHPRWGSEMILSMKMPGTAMFAICARQHHEHVDGRGYPYGIEGPQIHLFGRISAIADVYDALTSVRPYKKPYPPHVAYNIMINCSPGQFDRDLLTLFFANVALYPVGTVLQLTSGYCIVKEVTFGQTGRPRVILFSDAEGRRCPPREIDLYHEPGEKIEKVITGAELLHYINEKDFDPASLLAED